MNTIEAMELRLAEVEKRLAGQSVLIETLWGIFAGIDDEALEAREAEEDMQAVIDAKKAFNAWCRKKDAA